MIEIRTLFRCGMIWLFGVVFVIDGGRLLRAQESEGPSEPDDSSAINEDATMAHGIPDWFDPDSRFSNENRVLFVTTAPKMSPELAEQALIKDSLSAIRNELEDWLQVANPQGVQIDAGWIKDELSVKDHWQVTRDLECEAEFQQHKDLSSVQFYRGYGKLVLNEGFRDYLVAQSRELVTQQRLMNSGLVGGTVLALLAVVFGYLKMETATRGFYSRRLQTGSLIVAIAVVLTFYWIGQQLN